MPTPAAILHFRHVPSSLVQRPSLFPISIPILASPFTNSPTLIPRSPLAASRAYASQPERRLSSTHWKSEGGVDRDGGDEAFQKTLRLVECAMFASVSGLAYFLSNSLSIENYFGCFFPLPIVISSVRWGLSAGRKTMVATAILLLTLAGPVKALNYLLMHGIVGFVMGSLWRLEISWALSILLTTIARAVGACGYVLVSSFLIRENILSLITINIHASITYILQALGVSTVPTMQAIYILFGVLLLFNCGFLVFLLHILYAICLTKLGMRGSLRLPSWMDKAI
ncbi:putative membrane protein [Carex littledalei]|uniref:Putative membrane protein n=1 Tax=Carex littledalei TaxID=544730 RepID=A0A833QN53_9POAL|nr:putative membrane protein [Carex littledalei]